MPIEFHREGPWEVPDGWVWARLGDLVSLRREKVSPDQTSPFPFVGMDDVPPNSLRIETTGEFRLMKSAGNKFYPHDVLYGRLRPYLNKVVVPDFEGVASGEFIVLRAPDGIEPRYLQYFMHARRFINLATKDTSGDRPRIDFDKIAQAEVPLPPSAEQRRIVARIDELFTDVHDGEATLARARDDLDAWRRALLKAAVTGELTREWRELNRINEPAIDVLESLRGTRINLRKGGRTTDGALSVSPEWPKLPETWAWTSINELAESIRNGTSKVPRSDKNQNEILRISSVRPLLVDVSQIRYLDDQQAKEAEPFKVENGDLLFTRYNGSADLVGVGAKYVDAPRFYPDKLIRVRLKPEVRDYVDFIEIAVNTWLSRRHIAANIKTTAGQQGISGESLKATPIPLPPRSEAAAIVQQIKTYEDNDIKTEFTATQNESSQLRQAVLKAAFEGRLIAQDPRDEPAERLLARLAAQDDTMPYRRPDLGKSLARKPAEA